MKLLIVSDTHGNIKNLTKVIKHEKDASVIIHLGDGEKDILQVKKSFPNKEFIQVKGNCDYGSSLPLVAEYNIYNQKILITHGHIFDVKNQIYPLYLAAKEKKASVVLFGHTHSPFTDEVENIKIINPGSISSEIPTYGIVDIYENDVKIGILNLKKHEYAD